MPNIFDNIETHLLPALQQTIELSDRADFCVGFFNLRGWKAIDSYIDRWSGGEGHCCRLLVGMQRMPNEEIQALLGLMKSDDEIDNATAIRLKRRLIEAFKEQLTVGAPTDADEIGLRQLAEQIKAKKVVVKLFLRHPLHAKLYMLFRPDPINPIVGYLGSSNLTFAGLSKQGELNIDVLDTDACKKLAQWFEDRWNDQWCIDISADLVKVIEESWARPQPSPYLIYLKMAYHLSREAREGVSDFKLPPEFRNKLFAFQEAAVKIAAHHLNKRGGVLIGDVVGLGKTIMATALARIFEDDQDLETLIICPKNLVAMWTDYRETYGLRGRVVSISRVTRELPDMKRYRLLVIDESHNLRNREGSRYSAIREYIQKNDSKCILLSATPYNKTYLDLSSQLRLFLNDDQDLPIRPERYLNELGEAEFTRRHQCSTRSLAAFEKSGHADDWRELMRLYLVRRTRSFIMDNYARSDSNNMKYLPAENGDPYYFPSRIPRTVKFTINDKDPNDQYARLFSQDIVDTINSLHLPRYGLGNYVAPSPDKPPARDEAEILRNLSRAGRRLMGFCRTNLFKRLESSGQSFLLSVERHILRNYVYLHAIETGSRIPIGAQDSEILDTRFTDEDSDSALELFDSDEQNADSADSASGLMTPIDFKKRAAEVYLQYENQGRSRFDWLRPDLFDAALAENLRADADAMLKVLNAAGEWDPAKDTKLTELRKLMLQKHPREKVIVFSQFADTVKYLESQLKSGGVDRIAGVTGSSSDPTGVAWRFSPESNGKRSRIKPEDELRVVLATDILSEGQNLQDCAIVVNFDLPWAIIRLIQRIGRVDRIGQKADNIFSYTFMPADGVEKLIRLRARVRQRLKENAEVVGTDEAFFEDDRNEQAVRDLFTEKAGILDSDVDNEVDLASYAYQIWKNAVAADPRLEKIIPDLPPVVYSTKQHQPTASAPQGALVYMRSADDNDALIWMSKDGKVVTESQKIILDAARCSPGAPPAPRLASHHDLVRTGVEHIIKEERAVGGQLGRPSGARRRAYERLMQYAQTVKDTLFDIQELHRSIEEIYRYPLKDGARDALNRLLRAKATDETIARKVMALRDADALCAKSDDAAKREPRIICSLGLSDSSET